MTQTDPDRFQALEDRVAFLEGRVAFLSDLVIYRMAADDVLRAGGLPRESREDWWAMREERLRHILLEMLEPMARAAFAATVPDVAAGYRKAWDDFHRITGLRQDF